MQPSLISSLVGPWCTQCLVTLLLSVPLIILAWGEASAALTELRRAWRRARPCSAVALARTRDGD